jgi:hypothetical protein
MSENNAVCLTARITAKNLKLKTLIAWLCLTILAFPASAQQDQIE